MFPQNAENGGARNGAFLVLDVGSNTFGFNTSSTFQQPSHQPLPAPPNTTNNNATSSTEEEATPGSQHRNRASKKRDPDWVPEKNVRNRSRSSYRSVRSKPTPPIATSLPYTSTGQLGSSGSGAPPEYLVNLLSYSGWKVEFRQSSGDHVYISPAGHVYCSAAKAYEAFLHRSSRPQFCASREAGRKGGGGKRSDCQQDAGTSKQVNLIDPLCKEKEGMDSGVKGGILGNGFTQMGSTWNFTADKGGGGGDDRDAYRGGATLFGGNKCTPIGWQNVPVVRETADGACGVGVKDRKKQMATSSQGMQQESGNSVEIRRSRRTNRKPLPTESCVSPADGGRDKGKPLVPVCVLDEETHSNLSGESTGLCWMMDKGNQHGDIVGIRRSDRIKGKHVPVDDGPDAHFEAYDGYLDLCELAANNGTSMRGKGMLSDLVSGVDSTGGRIPWLDDAPLNQTEPGDHNSDENYSASPVAARKKKKKKRNGGCGLTIRRAKKNDHHEEISTPTKICILSWLIDSGTLTEKAKVTYITKNSTNRVSSGLVTREGILCECCEEVMSLQKFQAHAGGSNLHRPWYDIFLQSGKALIECLSEAWEKVKEVKKIGFQVVGTDGPDPSDDTCGICADGGHLICCDGCPSTFHQGCVRLKALPEGSWYCPYCRCTFCAAAECGSGRAHETLALFKCEQCGCKYHRECAWKRSIHEMGKVSYSFCGRSCKQIADQLSEMLGISYPIEGGFSWTLVKRLNENEKVSSGERLSSIMECNAKLSMAFTVLDECFAPLKDQRTGLDMMCQAVYNCGSNFNRLNYEGFYTLILEKDEEIISAATLRFHGTKLAEMPFIGTRPVFRMQGMCRRLLKAIEDMLSSLFVEKLVIPAIPDLLETWRTSFSFNDLESSHKEEIRNLGMVVFPCTTLLQKSIFSNDKTGQKGNVASKSATTICFQADDMPADNSVNPWRERQETNELPGLYGEHIYIGGNVARGQDWCGQKKDAIIKPCRTMSDSIFAPGLLNPSCRFREQKDATRESYKMTKDSKIPRGATLETSAIDNSYISSPSMLPENHTMTAFSFPSVNVNRDNDPESARIFKSTWLRSRDEAIDIHNAAIRSSLAFDSLLRIRS